MAVKVNMKKFFIILNLNTNIVYLCINDYIEKNKLFFLRFSNLIFFISIKNVKRFPQLNKFEKDIIELLIYFSFI